MIPHNSATSDGQRTLGWLFGLYGLRHEGRLLSRKRNTIFTIYPDYQPEIQPHRHKLRARIARRACSACRPRTGDYETSARSANWSFTRRAHPFQPRRWSRREAANLIFFGKKAGFAETED